MPQPAFVHLRLHSEYSVSDGLLQPDAALERAKALGMPALAITDSANLFGLIKFYRAAMSRDDAAMCRAEAAALAALLQAAGAQVLIPAEGQLSLFGDGQ